MPGLQDIPGNHVMRLAIQSAMASATTDDETVIGVVPFNATITGIKWTPKAAVTADGTNFSVIDVRNRKADASGTAKPASRSYVATNSVAFVSEATTLDATAVSVAAGDVLTVERIHTASGVVIPAGVVEVSMQWR